MSELNEYHKQVAHGIVTQNYIITNMTPARRAELENDIAYAVRNAQDTARAELITAGARLVQALDEISVADESGEIAAMSLDEIRQMNQERDEAHEALRAAVAHARGEGQ